jgi:hypothetical protein
MSKDAAASSERRVPHACEASSAGRTIRADDSAARSAGHARIESEQPRPGSPHPRARSEAQHKQVGDVRRCHDCKPNARRPRCASTPHTPITGARDKNSQIFPIRSTFLLTVIAGGG